MSTEAPSISEIGRSEIVIARILNLLMEWGIQECELEFKELGLDEEFAPHFFPCVEWLIYEGIIRAKDVTRFSSSSTSAGGKVYGPQLTSFGFRVLGSQITIGESQEKLGNAVKEVSDSQRSYSQVGDFFGGLLGGFTKSIGS